ncbi:50S ribosomal protein L24 [Pseudoramibacter sp.]|jgi:large subunit ribosomal protein L24|uniref:50S ribosomal protein L24 n=1 Tax=Pseudoramibacter sp. TaxID=2034862 RepID=UPI0025F60E4F|nr:50S ribosomal protein L24 [Pseudoramibacter sp.]MCH4072412.1 50S ribosomal protein L24 [Pseudoramibacter sp.]MCH4106183.1 50S ribosomal protein L24 [Pseudoramibacter sp.]
MTRKLHVKTGDNVQVISGKDLGKTGKVIAVDFEKGRVKVEGVNIQTKHKKATQAMQQGSIVKQEGFIDASNVLLFCEKCGKGVRTGIKVNEDGSKVRVCKKCGTELD